MSHMHEDKIDTEGDERIDNQADQIPNKGAAGVNLDQIYAGQVHGMSAADRQTILKLAQVADPGLPMFSYRMVKFVAIALVVCACSGDNGESSERSGFSTGPPLLCGHCPRPPAYHSERHH